MAITTEAQFAAAMENPQIVYTSKGSLSSFAANLWGSTWRATGIPPAATIPAAAAICNELTNGCIPYRQASTGNKLYLAEIEVCAANAYTDIQFHDRLAHSGGLSGTLTTVQTTNLPIDVSGTASNLVARRGATDYSELQWWLEWYTATGAAQTAPTINYTATDDTTGSMTLPLTPASVNVGRLIPLNQPADGKFIKRINSVQFSVNTGSAGNIGITVTRPLSGISTEGNNIAKRLNVFGTGFPCIPANACLMNVLLVSTTTTGTIGLRAFLAEG